LARAKRPSGKFKTEHHHLPKQGSRRVRVYLPSSYDDANETPILLLFDGQNVFGDEGSFAGGWRAHEAVERLGKKRPRPIVVGIDHAGADRITELSPWTRGGAAGGARAFVTWVVDHLVVELRRKYNVVGGPVGVLVAGSSLGGLAATYAHFERPDAFGGALAMSPSFWLARGKIIDFVGTKPNPWTSQVYIDTGAREGGGRSIELVNRMATLLRGRGYTKEKLRTRIDSRGTHSELAWRRRFPGALRFFYR
jgi:predicted alpha/beta superfamily hydrolase